MNDEIQTMQLVQFGKQLASLRKKIGLSQRAFAVKLNQIAAQYHTQIEQRQIDGKLVSKWERAFENRRPNRDYMRHLIELFAGYKVLDMARARDWALMIEVIFNDYELLSFYDDEAVLPQIIFDVVLTSRTKRLHRWQTKKEILLRATAEAARLERHKREIELVINLAQHYQARGYHQQAIVFYRNIIPKAQVMADEQYLLSRVQNNLAYLYTETDETLWPEAEKLCLSALKRFDQLNDYDKLAHAHNHAGVLYSRWKRYSLATSHLMQAQRLWEGLNDPQQFHSLINLGLLYIKLKNYPAALDIFFSAEQLPIPLQKQASIQMNKAVIYRHQGRFADSEALFQQAETVFCNEKNLASLARVRGNLGLLFIDKADWLEAKLYLDSSQQIWSHLDNSKGLEQTQHSLAIWQNKRKQITRYLLDGGQL
ncbi:tetratricopeptide repeat protein [Anaerolineales bacterium HSG6]|nr:tetratricopeptide repeat protein [Anaerolineales bacterium HSG6]